MAVFVRLLFLIGECFTWQGSRPSPIFFIFFIAGVRTGGKTPSLCSTQIPLQVIDFLLESPIIAPLLGCMTFPSRMASACVGGIYATFTSLVLIFFPFEVKKVVLPLGIRESRLSQT